MSYPTGMLSLTLEKVDLRMIQLRKFCVVEIAVMAAGDVPARRILERIYAEMTNAQAQFTLAAAMSGIGQYAKDQKNSQGLDVVAEFNAVTTAVQAAADWVLNTFPQSGGYLQATTLEAGDATVQQRQFSPAQTAGLRTALQGIVDAID